MLPSQKAQANSIVFFIGSTIGIVLVVCVGVWGMRTNTTVPTTERTTPPPTATVDAAAQVAAYQEILDALIAQEEITDQDMQTFLFDTRVPMLYQTAHLELATDWSARTHEARLLLTAYTQQIEKIPSL